MTLSTISNSHTTLSKIDSEVEFLQYFQRGRFMKRLKVFCVSFLIIFFSSGCSFSTPAQPTSTKPVLLVSTNTPLPTSTNTPTSTATATSTVTSTLRATRTNLPTASPTPIWVQPTVDPESSGSGSSSSRPGGLIWPRASFSDADISWRSGTCADEGKNLSCEIEYRKDSSKCYVGMSCWDACGWYYSVNKIPSGVTEYSGPCY